MVSMDATDEVTAHGGAPPMHRLRSSAEKMLYKFKTLRACDMQIVGAIEAEGAKSVGIA